MTTDLWLTLGPAAVLVVLFFAGAATFALRVRRHGLPALEHTNGRGPSVIATRFWLHYVLWLVTPVDRALARGGVSPNALTLGSLALSGATAAAVLAGHLGTGAWLFVASGVLDLLDGRVARRSGRASPAGAFLDSVADRWGELIVLGSLALVLRNDALALAAALLCSAGSQMVSYTRARGEGLGLALTGGTMQRTERLVLLAIGLIVAEVGQSTGAFAATWPLAITLASVAAWSTVTAVQRLASGVRALAGPAPAAPPRRLLPRTRSIIPSTPGAGRR
jgi:phosphatidylglycerophosphate synthase